MTVLVETLGSNPNLALISNDSNGKGLCYKHMTWRLWNLYTHKSKPCNLDALFFSLKNVQFKYFGFEKLNPKFLFENIFIEISIHEIMELLLSIPTFWT